MRRAEPDQARAAIARYTVVCTVDGDMRQRAHTSDLLFRPAGGVGAARDPKLFLAPGQVVRAAIEGRGECRTTCVAEKP